MSGSSGDQYKVRAVAVGKGPPNRSCGFSYGNSALPNHSPADGSQGISTLTSVLLLMIPSATPAEIGGQGKLMMSSIELASPGLRERQRGGWGDQKRFGTATIVPTLQMRTLR